MNLVLSAAQSADKIYIQVSFRQPLDFRDYFMSHSSTGWTFFQTTFQKHQNVLRSRPINRIKHFRDAQDGNATLNFCRNVCNTQH